MRVCSHRQRTAVRLIVAVALTAATATFTAAPAAADDCDGNGGIRDRGGDVVGECQVVLPGQPGDFTVNELWGIYCSAVGPFQEGDDVGFYEVAPLEPNEIDMLGLDPTAEYMWYDVICWRDGRGEVEIPIIVEVTPGVPPEVIRDQVAARIEPPAPSPASSPPLADKTVVGVPTWLWLGQSYWQPIEVSETQGLVTVTVRATPTEAEWVMGDGGSVTCHGPGVEWVSGLAEDATDCSHTYLHSSYGEPEGRFEASVTVTWVFEWWINDAYQGEFGTVDRGTPFAVAVAEIQAVETGG